LNRDDAELLISIGFDYQLTPEELIQVRYCRTSKPNSNCRYNPFGCKHCSEYMKDNPAKYV
jgi:hypothetical protein